VPHSLATVWGSSARRRSEIPQATTLSRRRASAHQPCSLRAWAGHLDRVKLASDKIPSETPLAMSLLPALVDALAQGARKRVFTGRPGECPERSKQSVVRPVAVWQRKPGPKEPSVAHRYAAVSLDTHRIIAVVAVVEEDHVRATAKGGA
jgi:hypothetical protein